MDAPELIPVDSHSLIDCGPWLLAFREDWQEANLPPMGDWSGKTNFLLVELKDTLGGGIYTVQLPPAYESAHVAWDDIPYLTLQEYFYADHFCDCHRKGEVGNLPNHPDDIDYECCDVNRFVVQRIYSPTAPHVTLYSETGPCQAEQSAAD